MTEIFGYPIQLILGQVLIGLINGSLYAVMSLGLAIIFGVLRVVNFAHGAQFMMGAFAAWMLWEWFGINYWFALILSPIAIGIFGVVLERLFLRRLYHIDHMYGLLATYALALIIEGTFRKFFGAAGSPYPNPLPGGMNLGFMYLPYYRAWVIVLSLIICFGTWFAIERTRLGALLRAATENPVMVRALGYNVPLIITLTYGFGVALAAFGGVMAAPIQNVSPQMGSYIVAVIFAVVVIGGMGSIMGAVVAGFGLGVAEGLTKVFYPEGSAIVIFLIMILVLSLRPAGLFGRIT